MRWLLISITVLGSSVAGWAQQAAAAPDTPSTYCDFADGMEVTIQYATAGKEDPKNGKVWLPGGEPMTLFTQTPLVFNNVNVPVGAYILYVMPNKKDWTLIVNKNVSTPKNYDATQDLARAPMELGEVGESQKEVQVSLAHTAPKTCNLRIYYGKVGAFLDFQEK